MHDAYPQRPSRPYVSVIMPAYNEAAGVQTTLASVVAALQALDLAWKIVVDDGSTDATADNPIGRARIVEYRVHGGDALPELLRTLAIRPIRGRELHGR